MQAGHEEYKLTPNAFWGNNGPYYLITAAPKSLFARYGSPINDGDRESLGTYVFTSDAGQVVTVYFRANDIFSLLLKLARPLFWRSTSPVDFTVGAEKREEAKAFAQWLSQQLGVSYRSWLQR